MLLLDGDFDMVQDLLGKGVNINALSSTGATALMKASRCKYSFLVLNSS